MILETAPAFILKDLGGNTISLSELKKKIVFLDFWANGVVLAFSRFMTC